MDESKHVFWSTQPVKNNQNKFKLDVDENSIGTIKPISNLVRDYPYELPPRFEWRILDIENKDDLDQLYSLLKLHYVEDSDAFFRLHYSKDFLKYNLNNSSTLELPSWNIGVFYNEHLLAFISGVTISLQVLSKQLDKVVEVNFLCVHKELRSRRLAPIMIRELTRRANLHGIAYAIYTTGTKLPGSIAECRYYHRPINHRKLTSYNFCPKVEKEEKYVLPDKFTAEGIRLMEEKDCARVLELYHLGMRTYNSKIYQKHTKETIERLFLPRPKIVYTYVKETNDVVTDYFSFVTFDTLILINGRELDNIKTAYYYSAYGETMDKKELLQNAVIAAKLVNQDVFNALDIENNKKYFNELLFERGDGVLHYYLYNYLVPQLKPSDISICLH